MSKKNKKRIYRIIISIILLITVIILPIKSSIRAYLILIPYLIISYDVLKAAFLNIIHGNFLDEKFLMIIATFGAYFLKEYTEAVAVMIFYQIGQVFENIAVGKSRKNISELMDISPDIANVLRDGKEIIVSPDEVVCGETIIIKAGEKVPLDGVIIKGATSLNTSALTGESIPREVNEGDKVISGAINLNGLIYVKTESTYSESTVSKILTLVEEAENKKAKTENFITKFAKYYTPIVVFSAVILGLVPPLLTNQAFSIWIKRALMFLVVSCPCALVISVPLSFFGGIGGASSRGILIKGAEYIEVLSKLKYVVFDKTGTLTKGIFKVTAIHPEKMSKAELLDIAALAESFSTHPIAESIVREHNGHLDKTRIGEVSELSGFGIKAIIDKQIIYVGNKKLMDKVGISFSECSIHKNGTIIHIANDKEYLGHITVSDEIKPESKQALLNLKKLGIEKTVMLTGDTKNIADEVSSELSIDEIYAELLPSDKVNLFEKIVSQNKITAFVGDGINDAPVLARADIGIAMGALGSDAAIEAADVVLMDDNPKKLCDAIKIARKTMTIVMENIIFSLAVKLIILILGAVGFANMWSAIFADVGVMVIAVLNAMRSLKYSKNSKKVK